MGSTALMVTHRTRPGQRDAVYSVWRRHLAPAIAANDGHDAYAYFFDATEPDVIYAVQRYRSPDAATAFLETSAYKAYEEEVAALLVAPPDVKRIELMWSKNAAPESQHDEPRPNVSG